MHALHARRKEVAFCLKSSSSSLFFFSTSEEHVIDSMGRTALLLLGVLLLLHAVAGSHRVAVIGAGVGGATATHYLRKELGQDVEIDV